MKSIANEKGIALVTALLLTLISLAMVMALLYFITQGTNISASQKRYKGALDAAYGGVEVVTKEFIPVIFGNFSTGRDSLLTTFGGTSGVNLTMPVSNPCFKQKLTLPSSAWTACSNAEKSVALADIKAAPDMKFNLKGLTLQPGFNVFAKIVDTLPGNTDQSPPPASDPNGLLNGSGAAYNPDGSGSGGGISVKHIPVTYRIEVQGERDQNPREKANLSVLYAY